MNERLEDLLNAIEGVLSGAIPHPDGEVTLAMQDLHALEDAYDAFMETALLNKALLP